jgi:hypothetical protein
METSENHDDYQYNWVLFERDTILFVLRAIDFYLALLGDEEAELSSDPDLAALITDDTRRELGLKRDKERTQRIKQWLEDKLADRKNSWDVSFSPSHWLVRFMKSVGLLYLAKLKKSRNSLASRTNVTSATLSAVDREISSKEEIFNTSGVFKNASPLELLASYGEETVATDTQATAEGVSLLTASRPRPILVGSIEILDHELRTRCLDLFNKFQESGQSDRNDTVVSEATRILENRLRTVTACEDGKSAKQLVTLAFNVDNPIVAVSSVRAEQEAAQLLFLGTFGFIRNQVQHKLLGDMPAERVLQILGWVDYLLSVISQSRDSVRAT